MMPLRLLFNFCLHLSFLTWLCTEICLAFSLFIVLSYEFVVVWTSPSQCDCSTFCIDLAKALAKLSSAGACPVTS